MKKHIIWSYNIGEIEDWKDFLNEEHPDVTDEDEQYQLCQELNDDYLDDEKVNCNFPCTLIVVGCIGLWNRNIEGWTKLNNLNEIFSFSGLENSSYLAEWYVENDTLIGSISHHAGHNHFHYFILDETKSRDSDYYKVLEYLANEEEVPSDLFEKYFYDAAIKMKEIYGWQD